MSEKMKSELVLHGPWDKAEIGRIEAHTAEDAFALVERARAAQESWKRLSFKKRGRMLLQVREIFVERSESFVDQLVIENGKPSVEAWFAEIIPDIELFTYWAAHAEKLLRPEKVRLDPIKFTGKKAMVHKVPLGVVGVISAWNYPVALPLRAIIPALMAGNSVVFKPATDAMLVGKMLADCFTEVLPQGVFLPFFGPGSTGSAIIEAGIDHLVFIGGVEVGREVAALAGRNFIGFSLELGGKDAAIVMADANIDHAVEGVTWGAFTNGGQNCASIERLLVHESIADDFIGKLVERTKSLRVCAGRPEGSDVGPLRNEGQLTAVDRQVADAKAKGAKILCGGQPVGEGYGYLPTVIDRITDDMIVWHDETFGPLLPLRRFSTTKQAIDMANVNKYGLTNSIWTSDLNRARELALQLNCGVVTVNGHAFSAAIPSVPWGGIKHTGLGSTNSHHAINELVRPQLVLTSKAGGRDPWWYPYDKVNLELARALPGYLIKKKGIARVLRLLIKAGKPR